MKNAIIPFAVAAFLAVAIAVPSSAADEGAHKMMVFKSPTCGCCQEWVEIMSKAGFNVSVKDVEDIDTVKKLAAIPEQYQSCHTAKVGGYIVEGHVPASTIQKLLREKPDSADDWICTAMAWSKKSAFCSICAHMVALLSVCSRRKAARSRPNCSTTDGAFRQ